ncbi:CoA pyrophosphatase [Peptoniphilus equinus]|uniref:CoA pyrophosphatase n=1 Tax=Peptoniphilus equinus TaxID=3016343 RepID=A0ABY7QUQ3_9FIRM|nr:CoA pyrophosphatase [Peptoniphilus equinus]WBW50086.1 CoA pyrophosphatase [Peptoniphilus equinus]
MEHNLSMSTIKTALEGFISLPVGVNRRYSVLIPMVEVDGEVCLLYEVRSDTLRSQPGEVSFPGGRIEAGETPRDAAVRETVEELLVAPEDVAIVMESDFLVTRARTVVYSFCGELKRDPRTIDFSTDEVKEIFWVPVRYFLEHEPKIYHVAMHMENPSDFPYELIPNGKDYNFMKATDDIHFYTYNDHVIWGFTAQITYAFAVALKRRLDGYRPRIDG